MTVRRLGFLKFEFLMASGIQSVNTHHRVKFCDN